MAAHLEPDSIDFAAYEADSEWPHSVPAEQNVLGAMLAGSAWPEWLTPGDFHLDQHRVIAAAVAGLAGAGEAVDPITVFMELQRRKHDGEAGGIKYLNDLHQSAVGLSNIEVHAEQIRRLAQQRRLMQAGEAIKNLARRATDAGQAAADAQQLLASATTGAKSTRPRPVTLDLRALAPKAAPPREWFISGWLGPDPTLFAAAGGVGKTLLAQQTATALAIGSSFIGEIRGPRRSLMWCCEDDAAELWRRQERISQHLGIELDEPADNLVIQSRRGVDNVLMSTIRGEASRTGTYRELHEQVNDLGVDVLWLDNVAHLFAGDENNRGEVTSFLNSLAGLVTGRPFAIVLLAHTSRQLGSEFSGSAAWENACRSRWFLGSKLPGSKAAEPDEEEGAEAIRYLARRKANYAARDYVRFTLRDGVLVPDQEPTGPSGIVQQIDQRRADEVVLMGFKALHRMGIKPADGKTSPDFLPAQMLAKGLAEGFSKPELVAAMNRLMGRGVLSRGVVGQYPNRAPRHGLVMAE